MKNKYRILVVEDNMGDYFIVEQFLKEQFFNPSIAHHRSFEQTLAMLSSGKTAFDVVLLDLTLPDMNGEQLIEEMLAAMPHCPIIILTGFADIDFSIKSISQGIVDYLLKDDLNAGMLSKSIVYAIERNKIARELKATQKRYSTLFYLSPQPMWVSDPQSSRFLQVNNAAVALYGYSEKEFMQMTVMDIGIREEILQPDETVNIFQHSDAHSMRTYMHQKKSGEKIEVQIFSTPIVVNDRSLISVLAIDVTEKKQFEHSMMKAIIKTQEDERYEIGGELHDNVCQILGASLLNLSTLKESLHDSGGQLLEQLRTNINLALDEIRSLSHRLAPVFFDGLSLEEAFHRLFESFNIDKKLHVSMHFDEGLKSYPPDRDIQLNLYRILQEQLSNILKYSGAKTVEVSVGISSNNLSMKVSDDGKGFNIEKVSGGIGLANMKRRTELFGGSFELTTSPGYGCRIEIVIPLPGITVKHNAA